MAGYRFLVHCLGRSLLKHGPKMVLSVVPFAGNLYDIAVDVVSKYREANNQDKLKEELEAAAEASPAEVQQVVDELYQTIIADVPPELRAEVAKPEVRLALGNYLAQMPACVRQTMRGPVGARSAPLRPDRPEELASLLPTRNTRFHAGERPAGNWVLSELLGVGGFGEVWKAEHPTLKGLPPVALKFCLDEEAARTLRHEAQLLSELMQQSQIPGIVPLRNAYLDSQPPCLEYEFVGGGDLTGVIRDWQRLPPALRAAEAALMTQRLAGIIGQAHRLPAPVVHRDLKPANILFSAAKGLSRGPVTQRRAVGPPPGAAELDPRIADFGIGGLAAQHALDRHTRGLDAGEFTSGVRGAHTPLYSSPQQAQGEPPDPRDDVHALGVIWFQMLTGRLNHGVGVDYADDLHALGVPAAQVQLLGKCVAVHPDRRPRDGVHLAELLTAAQEDRTPTTPATAAPTAKEVVVAADGSGDFRTIRAGVAACTPGGRVRVRRGVYIEGLVLDKEVEIIGDGEPGAVVLEAHEGQCLRMETAKATVRHLTLRGAAGKRGGKAFAVEIAQGELLLDDCDITNDSLACVVIHGAGTNPTLRGCRIHDSKAGGGVFITAAAKGVIENCEVFANKLAGVEVKKSAQPTLRGCKLHDNGGPGLLVLDLGQGTLERCELTGNRQSGAEVRRGGSPTLRDCVLRGNQDGNIFINDQGVGLFERCEVTASPVDGVAVTQGGMPTLRACKIHHNKESGVFVSLEGKGLLEGCEIHANRSGVEIRQAAEPTVRACKIHSNASAGVWVHKQGKGVVTECELKGNGRGAWQIELGCAVKRSDNRE
jgi:parallel beta-helix repeat protein